MFHLLFLCILPNHLIKYVCWFVYIQLLILHSGLLHSPRSFNLKDYMSLIRPIIYTTANSKTSEFSLLSYNVLAHDLLAKNHFLYDWSNDSVLKWEYRRKILLNEMKQFNADIICFQEIQRTHIQWYMRHLSNLGYRGVYKKRTNANTDGCAIYYKNSKFKLRETVTVEYNQPGVDVLNRDNVGIVLRLSPRENEKENLIVSTTHILYNQNRHDIKLAQVHLLMAEIERVSYKGHREIGNHTVPIYHPIILTGDFNLEPNTAVYDFLINGALHYGNLQKPVLWSQLPQSGRSSMGNELIPKSLGITENSQHANILELRRLNNYKRQTNDSLYLQLYHSERNNDQKSTISPWEFKFGTGNVYHCFNFSTVYNQKCCSTFHNHWTIVDYIFYTKSNLILKSYMKLPNLSECQKIPRMPNSVIPSDHLPLFATFSFHYDNK